MSDQTDSDIKPRFEKALAEGLDACWPADGGPRPNAINPGKAGSVVENPYCVVRVNDMEELVPGEGAFKALVQIVMVSHSKDRGSEAHKRMVASLRRSLRAIPKPGLDAENGVILCGIGVVTHKEASQGEAWGDVLEFEAGIEDKA